MPRAIGQRDLPLLPATGHRIVGFFDRLAKVMSQIGYVFVQGLGHIILNLKVRISQRRCPGFFGRVNCVLPDFGLLLSCFAIRFNDYLRHLAVGAGSTALDRHVTVQFALSPLIYQQQQLSFETIDQKLTEHQKHGKCERQSGRIERDIEVAAQAIHHGL